jgi:hypothetical protein
VDGDTHLTRTLLGIDLAGRLLSKSAGDEAAGSGGSDLQVIAAFPKPVEDFAVAGGKGHLEVGSWFRGGQVQDGVDQSGSGAHGQRATGRRELNRRLQAPDGGCQSRLGLS